MLRIVPRIMFSLVSWGARNGLVDAGTSGSDSAKQRARKTGVRGETYAYWYLRRHGYIMIGRNFMVPSPVVLPTESALAEGQAG